MAVPQSDKEQVYVPTKQLDTPYPLIDSDPYARQSDYAFGAIAAAAGPALMYTWEKWQPTVGRGGFAGHMRLTGWLGLFGGFGFFYSRSLQRFYGLSENKREVELDMSEMVDKVKKGEPLYGHSALSPYMQGVAARNSRYSGFALHIIPWFGFVNHNQHGVDTAKYYRQAERELAAEDAKKS